jgi:hypothetical protein
MKIQKGNYYLVKIPHYPYSGAEILVKAIDSGTMYQIGSEIPISSDEVEIIKQVWITDKKPERNLDSGDKSSRV